MTSYNDPNIRRELIMKHYSTPEFKSKLEGYDVIDVYSNQCVDELHLGLKIKGDTIIDAKWDGIGCAVFQSSTDIFVSMIQNKTKEEVKELSNLFKDIINGKDFNNEKAKELAIFDNVGKQLNRLHCAEMIIRAIEKAL